MKRYYLCVRNNEEYYILWMKAGNLNGVADVIEEAKKNDCKAYCLMVVDRDNNDISAIEVYNFWAMGDKNRLNQEYIQAKEFMQKYLKS